jgi:uncharacterized repeat protein (TIGR02543 family)
MPATTVQYNGNGADGGNIPNPQYFGTYTSNIPVSVTIAAQGSLTKTGFTFNGWNTAADGSGTNYAAGAIYGGAASLILYAKWI